MKSAKTKESKFTKNNAEKCFFCWIFDGKGNHTQKHKETDYIRVIARNYKVKTNRL